MTEHAIEDHALELPDLGEGIDGEGVEPHEQDGGSDLRVEDDGGDPFDDRVADDVPLEEEIVTTGDEPTVVGDDSVGIGEGAGDDAVPLSEDATSLLDDGRGHAEEGLDFGGDGELGIDPIPTEADDGGLEGLTEGAEQVERDELPPLDGQDDDDEGEELDLGLDLRPPPREQEN
jgi:hypothetical protein